MGDSKAGIPNKKEDAGYENKESKESIKIQESKTSFHYNLTFHKN